MALHTNGDLETTTILSFRGWDCSFSFWYKNNAMPSINILLGSPRKFIPTSKIIWLAVGNYRREHFAEFRRSRLFIAVKTFSVWR